MAIAIMKFLLHYANMLQVRDNVIRFLKQNIPLIF